MQTSVFLAQLLGPLFVVMGVGMLINPAGYRATAKEFLASRALIYIAGLAAFVPGLAVVLVHNVWTPDWRGLVTLFGWLGLIGGAFRMLAPEQVRQIGGQMIDRPAAMAVAAVAVTLIGAIFVLFGYVI